MGKLGYLLFKNVFHAFRIFQIGPRLASSGSPDHVVDGDVVRIEVLSGLRKVIWFVNVVA